MTSYLSQNLSFSEEQDIYNETVSIIKQGMKDDIYIDLLSGIWKLHFINSSSFGKATHVKDSKASNENSDFHHEPLKIIQKSIMVGAIVFIIVSLQFVRKKNLSLKMQRERYLHSFDESNFSNESRKSERNCDLLLFKEEEYSDYIHSLELSKSNSSYISSFSKTDYSICVLSSCVQTDQNETQCSTECCSVKEEDQPSENGSNSNTSTCCPVPKFDETIFLSTSSQTSRSRMQLPTESCSVQEEKCLENNLEIISSHDYSYLTSDESIFSLAFSVEKNITQVSTQADGVFSFCVACRTEAAWERKEPAFVSVNSASMYPFEHKHHIVCYTCGTRVVL